MNKLTISLVTSALLYFATVTYGRTVPDTAVATQIFGLDQNVTLTDGTVRSVRSYLTDFIRDFQKVQARKTKAEMKRITTAGLLAGIISAEGNMKMALSNMTKNLLDSYGQLAPEEVMARLVQLEQQMNRDKKSIAILNSALDLARNGRSLNEYVADIAVIGQDNEIATIELAKKRVAAQVTRQGKAIQFGNGTRVDDELTLKMELKKQINQMISSIEMHIESVHSMVKRSARKTIRYLKNNIDAIDARLSNEDLGAVETTEANDAVMSTTVQFENSTSALRRFRRQDGSMEKEEADNEVDSKASESESESSEEESGGLVGLIASLSGGDEGSDIGALVGVLSGVVTNLFGPGGLDVKSLLSIATSLISGLLAGEENFGRILGEYVGTSIDGLSGGGGAINNGQFFGQFLGTVIAALSADPEDEELPLKPKLFLENLFSGSKMATSKAGMEGGDGGDAKPSGGSDLFGFIGNIVGSIVAGVTSIIVNASVGSSGGLSQGSGDLSAGSVGASSGGSGTPASGQSH